MYIIWRFVCLEHIYPENINILPEKIMYILKHLKITHNVHIILVLVFKGKTYYLKNNVYILDICIYVSTIGSIFFFL